MQKDAIIDYSVIITWRHISMVTHHSMEAQVYRSHRPRYVGSLCIVYSLLWSTDDTQLTLLTDPWKEGVQ